MASDRDLFLRFGGFTNLEGAHDFFKKCVEHAFGEGNGNPLQCSCLENPRDGGAWWAAVCGVWGRTESDTTEAT